MEDKLHKAWYLRYVRIPGLSSGAEIPPPREWYRIIRSFTRRQTIVFVVFLSLCLASGLAILRDINDSFLVTVPARGGSLIEGVIGAPRFVNPLLAVSQADRDLTSLIYAGLVKIEPDGAIGPELAESFDISDDGLVYTFHLRPKLTWHDGKPLSARDVVFTVHKAQDGTLKSPKRPSFEGVSVEAVDDLTVRFRLERPFAPFLENATLGILPEHVWNSIDPDVFAFSLWNSGAIGSGPYQVENVAKDKRGIPLYYDLVPFEGYALGAPYISNLRIRFYPNDDALLSAYQTGEIESVAALSPTVITKLVKKDAHIVSAPLPRVFGVFFNQNQAEIFVDKNVRQALDLALSRSFIVKSALFGYATPINGPLPPGTLGSVDKFSISDLGRDEAEAKEKAIKLLSADGWQLDEKSGIRVKKGKPLVFTIATAETEELKEIATLIKTSWEAIGAQVTLRVFELGDLNQNVIRPRRYEALFFGEVVGREPDLFSFWHSSQRNDPGLNVAMYTNAKADKLIEEARRIVDRDGREKQLREIEALIKSDVPAAFIYAPKFLYVIPARIKEVELGPITTAAERFSEIAGWHIETERVWKYFIDEKK